MARRYWLLKSEPTTFSIRDLRDSKDKTNCWDGVRNYQARNFLRDEIKVGDGILFYHSNVPPVGIAGEAIVVRDGYPDKSAFDPKDHHYDPKSIWKKPVWFTVDIKLVRECREIISLQELRSLPALKEMKVLQRGMRLSVQPVTRDEWAMVMKLPEWGSKKG
ncbi:MAG TPA: EVE domain-containing protein [Nitrospiria bacterium]|nr:EVE domain-containing protein [Nitrospiria bacterium]